MLFNTPEFIFLFLPLAVALHFALARWSVEAAVVGTAVTSLLFYGWWNPPFVAMPIASIAVNFWIAQRMCAAEPGAAKRLLILGIAANLLVLCWFKYADFLLSILDGHRAAPPNVPLALSFTTFVQIAFLVDTWRRRTEVELRRYAMFVLFFPHLIAGPIVRWSELGPQLAEKSRFRFDWDNVALGLTVFTFGLAKKVLLADPLGVHVGPVFDAAAAGQAVTAIAAWGASIGYAAQIYFDFSGYSEMAIGIGLLFNLRLPVNFAAPLRATSVIDFWRRWHVTLSRFLRDFIYVPLGGRNLGPVGRSVILVATMTLGGLWHGAGWNFVLWGTFTGVLLAGNHLWRMWRGPVQPTSVRQFLGWLWTFAAFAVGLAIFRSADLDAAGRMLTAMAGFGNAPVAELILLPWDAWGIRQGYISEAFVRTWLGSSWTAVGTLWTVVAVAVALFVPDTMEIVDYREGEPDGRWRRKLWSPAWRPSAVWLGMTTAVFVTAFAYIGRVSEFLYYQF